MCLVCHRRLVCRIKRVKELTQYYDDSFRLCIYQSLKLSSTQSQERESVVEQHHGYSAAGKSADSVKSYFGGLDIGFCSFP